MYQRSAYAPRRRAYKSGSVFSVGPNAVRFLVLVLLAVFSLLYLVQSAQATDKALELRSQLDKQTNLDQEMTSLEANASRWKSLQSLSGSANSSGLVPVGNTTETLQVGK